MTQNLLKAVPILGAVLMGCLQQDRSKLAGRDGALSRDWSHGALPKCSTWLGGPHRQ